jgi:AcrR family transcriptional regulator
MATAAAPGKGSSWELNPRTRTRILDGALQAIARHGLTKLGMSDVSEHAGVSRGTLYRYFPSREDLLHNLAAHESERFQQRVGEALRNAPGGAARLRVALQHVTSYVGEHPAIQRLIENEPAFILRYLRDQFPALCATTGSFFGPLVAESRPVRQGAASPEQLIDWLTRVMISAVLFPDPDPDGMARGLTAVFALLAGPEGSVRAPRPRRSAKVPATKREGRRR